MEITAKITGVKYSPLMCQKSEEYNFDKLENVLSQEKKNATFTLDFGENNKIAISRWVSAKRTRSYPYARVYDTLDFSGKKVAIIPIFKDEGKAGDRDFLQWDTISLMSLLNVNVIIGYYASASRSNTYPNKITNQKFNIEYIKRQIVELLSYQSDALHWNMKQIDNIANVADKALEAYCQISETTGVEMHSFDEANKKVQALAKGKKDFMEDSRKRAERAQHRESLTTQPKEHVDDCKGKVTITNYLGGKYYFTADEITLYEEKKQVYLTEAKHTTQQNKLPALADIKDGLLKMVLFTNLESVEVDCKLYNPISVLKLTNGNGSDPNSLSKSSQQTLKLLCEEAKENKFKILFNDRYLN